MPQGVESSMRRLINSTYVTLDGVITNPQDWPSHNIKDESGFAIQTELLFACDALLMGRGTYESFAAVWPSRSDPYSDRINRMAKYVVSTTLRDPAWENTTVIGSDPVAAVKDLKQRPGMDIVQYGFGPLSHSLMQHGLMDELRLWVHPLFVGRGGPDALLYREGPVTMLHLADTRTLKNGNVILTYRLK
jgi:dihydrofolate reductase